MHPMKRTSCLALAALATSLGLAAAQMPPAEEEDPRVDKLLRAHAEVFRKANAVEIRFERLTRDRVFKTEESCRGVLRWQRPDDPNQPLRISVKMGPAEEPD